MELILLTHLFQDVPVSEKVLQPIDYAYALWWTLLGIIFVKLLIYPRKVKFSGWVWIRENLQDVLIGIVACPIIMQLGAIVLKLISYYTGLDMKGIQESLESVNLDPIKLSLVLSIFIQWRLFITFKKKENNQ